MNRDLPPFLASDLEGVWLPEIWLGVADKMGIEALRLTTREIVDYDQLMQHRLRVLAEHKLNMADVQAVIATLEPLPGAVETLNWIRSRVQLVILTDSFYEFLQPLLPKLGYPTVFAHSIHTDAQGNLTGYTLRTHQGKRRSVHALRELGFRIMAFGDSYNDTAMLAEADQGFFFCPPPNVVAEFPQFPVANDYAQLKEYIQLFLG